MPRLLIVHHSPSPATHDLLDAVVSGASDDAVSGVEVVVRPALVAGDVEALEADGYVLGTPANIGYMSGALKHFFDRVYYPCLASTSRRPYGMWIHGNDDVAGAARSVTTIADSLGWRAAHAGVLVVGPPARSDLEACWELGATLAAVVLEQAE